MSPALELNHPILEVLKPDCTTRLFGLGSSQVKVPSFHPDYLLFHVFVAPEGAAQFTVLTPEQSGGRIPGRPYDLFARVRRQCPDFPLVFPRRHTDAEGHPWDFVCAGLLTVTDGKRFVEQTFGLAALGTPLRRDRLSAWLAQELGVSTADVLRAELEKHTFDDLRNRNVLPPQWWTQRFAPTLERFGLQLSGLRVRWESAEAHRAEQAERERQEQARLQAQVEAEKRQRLEQARRDQELADLRAQLEAEEADRKRDLQIRGMASQDQLAQLALEYQRRRLQAEQKFREEQLAGELRLQDLERTMQLRALEHEQSMLALRDKAEVQRRDQAEGVAVPVQAELRRLQEQQQQAQEAYQAEVHSLRELKEELKKLFSGYNPAVVAGLFQGDASTAYTAASSLTTHGVNHRHLPALGIVTPLNFLARLPASTVQIRKNNLKRRGYSTRDIVVGPAKEVEIETLRISEKVDFELVSPRAGFITVLNPGTTGRFWQHTPNVYRPMPRVEARRTYQVPGPELLPEENLRAAGLDYYERGPEGWEYLVVIVSDEPLRENGILSRSRDNAPAIELAPTELQSMLDRLERLGWDRCAVGVAKFRVVRG